MSMHVCRCCGERMAASSPRNPHLCAGCEQLLEDDCEALNESLGNTPATEPQASAQPNQPRQDPAPEEDHQVFSKSI